METCFSGALETAGTDIYQLIILLYLAFKLYKRNEAVYSRPREDVQLYTTPAPAVVTIFASTCICFGSD